MTLEQLPGSVTSLAWYIAALVLLGAALRFWTQAATTMAGRLELQPRVRAVRIVLNAVATMAASALTPVVLIWIGQIQSDNWLLGAGVFLLVSNCRSTSARLWWAWHRGQRLRAAAAGGRRA